MCVCVCVIGISCCALPAARWVALVSSVWGFSLFFVVARGLLCGLLVRPTRVRLCVCVCVCWQATRKETKPTDVWKPSFSGSVLRCFRTLVRTYARSRAFF